MRLTTSDERWQEQQRTTSDLTISWGGPWCSWSWWASGLRAPRVVATCAVRTTGVRLANYVQLTSISRQLRCNYSRAQLASGIWTSRAALNTPLYASCPIILRLWFYCAFKEKYSRLFTNHLMYSKWSNDNRIGKEHFCVKASWMRYTRKITECA